MPHQVPPYNGLAGEASQRIPFLLCDDTEGGCLSGGPAQNEVTAAGPNQSEFGPGPAEDPVAGAVADAATVREDDTNEVRRGEWPEAGALVALEPAGPAEDGSVPHLARMVAADAAPQQAAYFRDARCALLGIMNPDGSISLIEPRTGPPAPPFADPPVRGELS